MSRLRRCPNCGGPEHIPTGIMGGGGPLHTIFYCGYLDSEDGIKPPRIPAMCRYTRSLLDKATNLHSDTAHLEHDPVELCKRHHWEESQRLDDYKNGIGHWECRDCDAYLTGPLTGCTGDLFEALIDSGP